jgi:hypothetical protein
MILRPRFLAVLAAPLGLALGAGAVQLALNRNAPAGMQAAHPPGARLSTADLAALLRRCRPENAVEALTPGADDVSAGHAAAAWHFHAERWVNLAFKTPSDGDAAALALRAVDRELAALASARGWRVEAGPSYSGGAPYYSYQHARRSLRPTEGRASEVSVWAVLSGDVLTVVLQCGETGLPLSRRAP